MENNSVKNRTARLEKEYLKLKLKIAILKRKNSSLK
jgi:hypothetical protein